MKKLKEFIELRIECYQYINTEVAIHKTIELLEVLEKIEKLERIEQAEKHNKSLGVI